MKIFGTGIDLLELHRFNKINTDALARRLLSRQELSDFQKSNNKHLFLAKKFCMKEAIAKALGVGIGKKLAFMDITIYKNNEGKPLCLVREDILKKIINEGVCVHISYSDTKTLISAYCVVELIT